MKGCGELIPKMAKWDEEDCGWICGVYYDALNSKMFCDKCKQRIKNGERSDE